MPEHNKMWVLSEIERALAWKIPFHCVIHYVKGTSVLDWNMHGIFPCNSEEESRAFFNSMEPVKPAKKDDDEAVGLMLLGLVKNEGKFYLRDYKGSKDKTYAGVLFSKAENKDIWEVSVGLTKAEKFLTFSELCVPMTDSVWYE